MNQLNYQHLYYFYVTATEGSIIKAASVLHLTPQTISEQIRTLEAYFGFDLFDRVGKRLQLNSQGQLTYNFAKNIFNMGNELLLSVRNQKQNQQHMLSIGVTDVLPKILAFEMFQRCLKAHPNVRFLFVNQGEGEAGVRAFLQSQGLALDHVLFDEAMAVPRHYGTAGIPVTLFLHADGRLAKAHMGEIAPEQIATEIARLH